MKWPLGNRNPLGMRVFAMRPAQIRFRLILLSLAFGTSGSALACDPITFNFDRYLADKDRNHDGRLQQAELLAAGDPGTNYGAALDRPLNTAAAFVQLDVNRDGALESEELWQWGKYTHDACADWNARQSDTGSWWTALIDWLKSWLP